MESRVKKFVFWAAGALASAAMLFFVGKRVAYMALTMVAVSLVVFLLLEVSPGSVATKVLGPYSSEEQRQLWLVAHGYAEPLWYRYGTWLFRFVSIHT